MNWLNPIFLIPILTAPIYILAAILMLKYPPKNINSLYGYRTNRSRKSQESWDFAQKYSAKKMIVFSVVLIILAIFGLKISFNEAIDVSIGIALILLACIVPLVQTEKKLKEKF